MELVKMEPGPGCPGAMHGTAPPGAQIGARHVAPKTVTTPAAAAKPAEMGPEIPDYPALETFRADGGHRRLEGCRGGGREVAEGMVLIPFYHAEAATNLLTNPQPEPYGKIPEFKFRAARLAPGAAA